MTKGCSIEFIGYVDLREIWPKHSWDNDEQKREEILIFVLVTITKIIFLSKTAFIKLSVDIQFVMLLLKLVHV